MCEKETIFLNAFLIDEKTLQQTSARVAIQSIDVISNNIFHKKFVNVQGLFIGISNFFKKIVDLLSNLPVLSSECWQFSEYKNFLDTLSFSEVQIKVT